MDQLAGVTGTIEHEDRAGRRPLDDRELEPAIDREGPEDPKYDDRLAAEVPLVKREAGRDGGLANDGGGLFLDEPARIVVALPGLELAAVPLGWARRAVGIADDRTERSGVGDQLRGHG